MVILSRETHDRILSYINQCIVEDRIVTVADCLQRNYDYDVVNSLYSQVLVRILKKEIKRPTKSSVVKVIIIFSFYNSSLIIIQLLQRDEVLNNDHDYALLQKKLIADISISSPENNLMRECLGNEYEEILVQRLTDMKLCFETEAQQRRRGKPKTPDILFFIPMAVVTASNPDPVVIHWIDSKAMYADETTFRENIEQLKGYNNRYGRGMVIYWYGFVETILLSSDVVDNSIVVTDSIPTKWFSPLPVEEDNKQSV